MLASQRRILLVGLLIEFLVALAPSWTRTELMPVAGQTVPVVQSAGFHPIFQPPTVGVSQGIDFGRLALLWLLIAPQYTAIRYSAPA